jgi:hypothetical protein
MTWAKQRAAALLVLGLPGMRFLHEGQLTGRKHWTPVQLTRRPIEQVDVEIEQGYRALLEALNVSSIGKGPARLLIPQAAWTANPTLQNFILVQWQTEGPEFDLVAVNYAPHRGQCFVPLELLDVPTRNWLMKDRLSAEEYVRPDHELRPRGLYLDVAPFGAHVFEFRPAD